MLRASSGIAPVAARSWIEQPYGEEEITILEQEVIPAIQQCLARVDEIDQEIEGNARAAISESLAPKRQLAQPHLARDQLAGKLPKGSKHITIAKSYSFNGAPQRIICYNLQAFVDVAMQISALRGSPTHQSERMS